MVLISSVTQNNECMKDISLAFFSSSFLKIPINLQFKNAFLPFCIRSYFKTKPWMLAIVSTAYISGFLGQWEWVKQVLSVWYVKLFRSSSQFCIHLPVWFLPKLLALVSDDGLTALKLLWPTLAEYRKLEVSLNLCSFGAVLNQWFSKGLLKN